MDHEEITERRLKVRTRKIIQKKFLCDMCRCHVSFQTAQMHEIFNRARTLMDSEGRDISYSEELTVILCQRCHDVVHNPEWRELLLRYNCAVYGLENVREKYLLLQAEGADMDVKLPEEKEPIFTIRTEIINKL